MSSSGQTEKSLTSTDSKELESENTVQPEESSDNFLLLLAEKLRTQAENLLQSAFLINSMARNQIKLAEALELQAREEQEAESPLVQITRKNNG